MPRGETTEDIFEDFVDAILRNVHTGIPGKIESYDEDTRKAKVKPLIKTRTNIDTELDIPPIDNVPVVFPSGKNFTLEWPLEKGDGCHILFSEEGMGAFLKSGGVEVTSDSLARFQLTDAICLPGLFSFKNVPASKATIKVDDTGNININGENRNLVSHTELNTALQGLVTAINATFATKLDGGGTPGTLTLSIASSKVNTVRVGT